MSSGVDLDLIKYIDPNLTWKTFRKGPRSETRCPRKAAGKLVKMDIGAEFGSNISKNVQDSSVLESEKLGVAILGEHFAEKTTAVPIKKRRLSRQSSSPPPRTPSLNGEASLSPEPNTPSPNNDESEQLVHSKSASGQWSYSGSYSKKRANKKKNGLGADGTLTREKTELTTREFFHTEDFSGIALLVAAACSSSIEENADQVESSGVEELATPEGKDASRVVMKESVTASESEGSSVPENALPVVQSLHCDNENDREVIKSVPSKDARFHWDLNMVMDEWEEPCFDPPPYSQGTCAEGIVDGDLEFQNLKKEGCERRELNIGRDIESKASDVEITSNKSDSVNLFAPPASTTSTLVGQDYVLGDSRVQDVVKGSSVDNIANDLPKSADLQTAVTKGHVKLVTEEAGQGDHHCQKSGKPLDDDKLASENPLNENGSEVFKDEQRHPADGDNMMKVQEGYDSPYEDGELREPLVHGWEENSVENMENECVDFEFDNQYEDDFDTGDHSILENFVVGREDSQTLLKTRSVAEKQVNAVPANDMVQLVKDVSIKPTSFLGLKTPEGYQLQEVCEDVNLEGNNSKFYSETKNGHSETRTLSGNMLHMEGSSPFDGLHRRGTSYMKRSRFDEVGETYSRTERVLGSEKDRLPFQGRVRNEVDRRWVDSAGGDWDSRNHYGYTRSRNVIGDPDGKPSGLNSRDHIQPRSYGPRDMYRPLNRRQSPMERNDSYPLYRRTQPGRGFRHERSRGRSGFIPQGFRRGPQEEYHEPGPYYLERKERGFSPNYNRDSHISRTRRRSPSRSRSRSISPIAWNMNNRGTKRPSPEFRAEGRVQGERFPFPKPSFSGDFDQGLISPPRGRRLSPQRNSRCFDDHKCMDGQYRERRSSPPVRMFRRNRRFDSVDYPERSKLGDFYRPATRPGRFPQMPNAGRGPRNFDESSYDRRKPDGRYDTMNRVRRYDAGAGGVKQFRYDGDDDCLEPRNARNENDSFRGPVRRAAPVSISEERSPPRIYQEKLFTAEAPLPGEHEDDGSRGPPVRKAAPVSISEERSPPRIYQEKLFTADAPLPGEHEDDGSRGPPVRKAAPVNIREERSPPRIHQEKLIAADAPLPGEQDFDVNASTKEV